MRINELFSEGVGDAIKTGMGVAGASVGQAMKSAALGALGLKNTQNQFQQKHGIGGYQPYDSQNTQQLVKQLGIKQGMDFQIAPNQKVRITKVDNHGATYIDPATKLPVLLGGEALTGIAQRQQALQTVAQMGQPAPGQKVQ